MTSRDVNPPETDDNPVDLRNWLLSSKDPEELRTKYNTFAASYEKSFDETWKRMHNRAAAMLERVLPAKEAYILDAGAGTGLVGEAVAKLGYTNIVGADLSEEMLAIASQKQVYKKLYQCNLQEPQPKESEETYDAILAIGLFGLGHLRLPGLQNLFPLLKSGGIFLMTLRLDDEMQPALSDFPWSMIEQEQFSVYETHIVCLMAFRKD